MIDITNMVLVRSDTEPLFLRQTGKGLVPEFIHMERGMHGTEIGHIVGTPEPVIKIKNPGNQVG